MKKVILFTIFLLNLLPNMNISTGSISFGWSTLFAQQMGNETAFFCNDKDQGWYISPIPCDEEVCHMACRLKDRYGYECQWEGDCDFYAFHVEVEHSDNPNPDPDNPDDPDNPYDPNNPGPNNPNSPNNPGPNNQNNSNNSSNNGNQGNNGDAGNGGDNSNQFYVPQDGDVIVKSNMKKIWKKQKHINECVPIALAYASELTDDLNDGGTWFKRAFYELYHTNVEQCGVTPNIMNDYIGYLFLYNDLNNMTNMDIEQLIRNAIDNHHPVLATITNNGSPHEVTIVGYNSRSNNTTYICINPGTGNYEYHTYQDFLKGNYHIYEIININPNLISRRVNI